MTDVALAAPVSHADAARRSLRARTVVVVAVVSLLVYQALGTWSIAQGFGGMDGDGHWIDSQGDITRHAPPTVEVVGHPAPIAVALILLATVIALLVPSLLARRGRANAASVVRLAATCAIPALLVVAILVFSVWQQHVVSDALATQQLHPPVFPFGGATVTTESMTR